MCELYALRVMRALLKIITKHVACNARNATTVHEI